MLPDGDTTSVKPVSENLHSPDFMVKPLQVVGYSSKQYSIQFASETLLVFDANSVCPDYSLPVYFLNAKFPHGLDIMSLPDSQPFGVQNGLFS